MLRSIVEIGVTAVLWASGLLALYVLVLLYESGQRSFLRPRTNVPERGREDTIMQRKDEPEVLPALTQATPPPSAPSALEVAKQVANGRGLSLLERLAAKQSLKREADMEEQMLEQVERKLTVRQRLAEGVGKTVDLEDSAKASLHRSQVNEVLRQRELQALLNAPALLPSTTIPPRNTPSPTQAPDDAQMKRLANQACVLICQSDYPQAAWEAYRQELAYSGYSANVRTELEELVQARLNAMDVL